MDGRRDNSGLGRRLHRPVARPYEPVAHNHAPKPCGRNSACSGTSVRIPVTGALLLWAVLLGVFFDNHQVGRRALIAETGGSTVRPTLAGTFKLWADQQPLGPRTTRRRW